MAEGKEEKSTRASSDMRLFLLSDKEELFEWKDGAWRSETSAVTTAFPDPPLIQSYTMEAEHYLYGILWSMEDRHSTDTIILVYKIEPGRTPLRCARYTYQDWTGEPPHFGTVGDRLFSIGDDTLRADHHLLSSLSPDDGLWKREIAFPAVGRSCCVGVGETMWIFNDGLYGIEKKNTPPRVLTYDTKTKQMMDSFPYVFDDGGVVSDRMPDLSLLVQLPHGTDIWLMDGENTHIFDTIKRRAKRPRKPDPHPSTWMRYVV